MLDIKEAENSVTFRVRLAPRSSRNSIVGEHQGALKIALTAPPVEGAANQALVEFLAKTLGIRKSAVKIIAGEKSKNKTVRVEGITGEAIKKIFNL